MDEGRELGAAAPLSKFPSLEGASYLLIDGLDYVPPVHMCKSQPLACQRVIVFGQRVFVGVMKLK